MLGETIGIAMGVALIVATPILLDRAARLAGWGALVAALAVLTTALGGGRGIALGLAFLPVPALVLIYCRRDPAVRRNPRETAGPARRRWRGMRAVARFLVAVPLAAVAALLMTAQLVRPIATLSSGIVAALAIATILWVMAMLWAVVDPRLRRPAGGISLAALIAALPLMLR